MDSLDKVLQSTKEEFANLKQNHLELQASSIVLKQEFDEKLYNFLAKIVQKTAVKQLCTGRWRFRKKTYFCTSGGVFSKMRFFHKL